MNKTARTFLFTAAMLFGLAAAAAATPNLQIDVSGGSYDSVDQSVVNTTDAYSVYALMQTSNITSLNDEYYLSFALIKPEDAQWSDSFGSFFFAGTTYQDLGQFTFGTPQGLSSHGVFPTYYSQTAFHFSPSDRASSYNVEDSPGGFNADPNGSLYYAAFDADITGLAAGWELHFDLFNTRGAFAPYSHDATTSGGGGGGGVPEPATLLLFGTALSGLGISFKRRMKNGNA